MRWRLTLEAVFRSTNFSWALLPKTSPTEVGTLSAVRLRGDPLMKSRMNIHTKRATPMLVLLLVMASVVMAQTATPKAKATVSQESVKKYMQGLASDEMRGRGSATADELAAAKYIASQLKLLKIEPAGDDGGYLQTVKLGAGTTTNVVGILRGSDLK